MTRQILVDPKSYALAEHFLADDDVQDLTPAQIEARTMSLAQAIQQAVEDWTEAEGEAAGTARLEPCDAPPVRT